MATSGVKRNINNTSKLNDKMRSVDVGEDWAEIEMKSLDSDPPEDCNAHEERTSKDHPLSPQHSYPTVGIRRSDLPQLQEPSVSAAYASHRHGSHILPRTKQRRIQGSVTFTSPGIKPPSHSTRLSSICFHPIAPADGGYLTALVENYEGDEPLLAALAEYGFQGCFFGAAELNNISVKQLTGSMWLLSASVAPHGHRSMQYSTEREIVEVNVPTTTPEREHEPNLPSIYDIPDSPALSEKETGVSIRPRSRWGKWDPKDDR